MSSASHDLILERSLLGALAALVPVPLLDDVLLGRARRSLLRTLADGAGFRLDARSLRELAREPKRGALHAVGLGIAARALRYAAAPLRFADRARSALVTFQLATLFDHYARKHHAGLDLDVARAKVLRVEFERAIDATPSGPAALRSPVTYSAALRASFDAGRAAKP